MMKPTLLIIINKLNRGGAELMLLGILKDLGKKYDLVIVTLGGIYEHEIDPAVMNDYVYYNLKADNVFKFIKGIFTLRKILKKHHVDVVHAHLFQSTVLARMACTRKLPFLFSVHSHLSRFVSFKEKIIEKITLRKNDVLIAVSEACREDYVRNFGNVRKSYVLLNYISDAFFLNPARGFRVSKPLRLVAVGNIKPEKNYITLVEAFRELADKSITLDIYGRTEHPIYNELERLVRKYGLPVQFKGMTTEVEKLFHQYDLFVSSSAHEGFGLTVIEAMASGLPVVLSDIPVFREITLNNALFFDARDPGSFVHLVKEILDQKHDLAAQSLRGKKIAENYTKEKYLEKLFSIYEENLPSANASPA